MDHPSSSAWLAWSSTKRAWFPATPVSDQCVRLGLDASGFVRQLEVLDAPAANEPSHDRDRQIRRMSALRSAATFCGGKALNTEVSTADVLKVASAFLKWLEGGSELIA